MVILKLLDFMGTLPEGDEKHNMEKAYVSFLKNFTPKVK